MHYASTELPLWQQDGSQVQLVLGQAWGRRSPVAFPGEALYAVIEMAAGAELAIPAGFAERGIYLASGRISLGGESLQAGELGLLAAESQEVRIVAEQASRLALLAGPTPDAHRILDWNFVSSSKERIEQAKADWRAGRMKLPDLDHDEFIPLPG